MDSRNFPKESMSLIPTREYNRLLTALPCLTTWGLNAQAIVKLLCLDLKNASRLLMKQSIKLLTKYHW